ncbi:MAG: branched-chain amino acid aminotransferase [Myxococcota bacterium]|jgi:branched-chain amino acid aminotransferase
MTMNPPQYFWFDGQLLRSDRTPATILEHGLHYGTGVFEGIRAYNTDDGPAIFRLGEHMDRFQRGADALGMTIDRDALQQACIDTLQANGHRAAYLRPIAWFSGPGLALDVATLTAHQAVATLPWTSHLGDDATDRGISLRTSSMRRNSRWSIPPLKLTGAYVNSILAKKEAAEHGFDEALFIDDAGMVCECTGENVFCVVDGQLIAVEHPDALPGITRQTLLDISDAISRPLSATELASADEIFVVGTSAEVTPITRFDGRTLETGLITRQLAAEYQDIVHGRDASKRDWLTFADAESLPLKDEWSGRLAAAGGY